MLKSTGCFILKFDLFHHTIFTGTYCLVWSFRPKRRSCKLERGQSHLGGAPNTCCCVVLETQCWADSDYLLLPRHRCNMLVFRALPFEFFNMFFNSQHSCKLSSGMCCCHIWTFSVYLIHPSILPSILKRSWWNASSDRTVDSCCRREAGDNEEMLCPPLLSAWKSPLWHMKHGPCERSLISKRKQTSLEVMVFLVVPRVSIFARGWDRVQVITRITASASLLLKKSCLDPTVCFMQQPCCYIRTE